MRFSFLMSVLHVFFMNSGKESKELLYSRTTLSQEEKIRRAGNIPRGLSVGAGKKVSSRSFTAFNPNLP
jgi:hypothetical protein